MREVIKEAAKKLEFVTGLKQMREYNEDQLKMLLDTLAQCASEYKWLTPGTLEYILKNGMRGKYGEFYHLNEKTLTSWIKSYHKDNEQKINLSLFKKEEEIEVSEEEKQYWNQIGNDNFKQKFEDSKIGAVPVLAEWGPYFYTRFLEKGLLKEEDYPIDESHIQAELRISGQLQNAWLFTTKKRDRIWRLFIKDMINKKIDLPGML